jgi:transcriptional regulator with XRE-family HTH domain
MIVRLTKRKEGVGVLGRRLKAERIRRGWTIGEFADALGCYRSDLTSWENRSVMPRIENLIAIAMLLECSIDYLVGLEDT